MKTLFIIALLAITITSCNHKVKETDGIETKSTSNELYACSMHPEITGKKGEEREEPPVEDKYEADRIVDHDYE